MKLNKNFPDKIFLDKRVLVNGKKKNDINLENHLELSEWFQYLIDNNLINIFICDSLNNCNLESLGNVSGNPINNDILFYNGTNWINIPFANLFSAINGLTKNGTTIKLGGQLIESTTVEGDYDFTLKGNVLKLENSNQSKSTISANNTIEIKETTNYNDTNHLIPSSRHSGGIQYIRVLNFDSGSYLNPNSNGIIGQLFRLVISTKEDTIFTNYSLNNVNYIINLTNSNHNGIIDIINNITLSSLFSESLNKPTINEFVQLKIKKIEDVTNGNSNFTVNNKFAIYQEGINDINRFFGEVQNNAGSVQFTSDERVKENIEDFNIGLDVLKDIQPKIFNYTYNKNKIVTGVIAQELEKVLPSAVKEGQFKTPDDKEFKDFKFINQEQIFYVMLNSIKELNIKIEKQNNLINELQNEINLLKK